MNCHADSFQGSNLETWNQPLGRLNSQTARLLFKIRGRNKKPNQTGRTEPNWTVEFRNRTRIQTEPNRTEPRLVRKVAGRTASNREIDLANRTEPNRWLFERSGAETKRSEPVPSCYSPNQYRDTCVRVILSRERPQVGIGYDVTL